MANPSIVPVPAWPGNRSEFADEVLEPRGVEDLVSQVLVLLFPHIDADGDVPIVEVLVAIERVEVDR